MTRNRNRSTQPGAHLRGRHVSRIAFRGAPALVLSLLVAGCAGGPKSSSSPDEVARAEAALREAAAALIGQDPKAALVSLDQTQDFADGLPAELRGRLELAYGEANLAYGRANGDQAYLIDAEASLEKATKTMAESRRAWVMLADARKVLGKNEQAIEAASWVIDRLEAKQAERPSKELIEPLLLRAEVNIRNLAKLRQTEDGEPEDGTVEFAETILADIGRAQSLDPRRPRPYELASHTYRWLGKTSHAIRALEDGVRADPSHHGHHLAIYDLFTKRGNQLQLVGLYDRLAREVRPESADVIWYLGRSHYALAASYREKGNRKSADKRYDIGEKTFARCADKNPGYAASCDVYRALCAVSKARMALDEGDEKAAESELDRAFGITPTIAAVDERGFDRYFDSFNKSYRGGIYALGARFMGGGARLDEARRFFRKVTARHADWGAAWNNLGLACRDLGVATQEGGDKAAAKKLYEESYAAYSKAVVYSPEDPRVQNDCGLMLVYHLGRDFDLAVDQFKKAIELGTAQLEDLPEKSEDESEQTSDQRKFLEEAVGDAWQNWALVFEKREDYSTALEKYRKSVTFYPYARREAARQIPTLEKKIGGAPSARKASKGGALARTVPVVVAWFTTLVDEIDDALQKLDAGDSEGVLDIAEKLLRKRGEDAEVWYLAGRGSLLFAKQRMQQGGQGVNENLIDAVTRLAKADELTRTLDAKGSAHLGARIHVEPVRFQIEALVLQGDAKQAWELGKSHMTHLDSVGARFADAMTAPLLVEISDAGSRKLIGDFRAGKKPGKELDAVRGIITRTVAMFEKAAKGKERDPAMFRKGEPIGFAKVVQSWASLEEWAGRPAAAIRVFARGAKIAGKDDRNKMLNSMLGVVGRRGGSDSALESIQELLGRTPRDAALVWYRGYARVLEGNELRLASKVKKAKAAYAKARTDLGRSIQLKPQFKNSANWWAAMSLNSEGWCEHAAGGKKRAKKLWLQAAKKHADAAAQKDALGRSAKDGILMLGGELYGSAAYEEGADLMDEFLAALGRPDADALNNIGIFMREEGLKLSGVTGAKRAFQRSWKAYKKAAEMSPTSARILNDAALVDVYYLKENTKLAEQLLRQAIEVGQGQLDNEPPDGEEALRGLEEAVGDARMNLGLLLIDDPKRWTEAETQLVKSLEYYPKERRASKRHLRRLNRLRRRAKKEAAETSGKKNGETGK